MIHCLNVLYLIPNYFMSYIAKNLDKTLKKLIKGSLYDWFTSNEDMGVGVEEVVKRQKQMVCLRFATGASKCS